MEESIKTKMKSMKTLRRHVKGGKKQGKNCHSHGWGKEEKQEKQN